MALNKKNLQKAIQNGFYEIFTEQAKKATSGDESEDPDKVIKNISEKMASVVSDAVDKYVREGDITVGPDNISAICAAPGSPATITPINPAKII